MRLKMVPIKMGPLPTIQLLAFDRSPVLEGGDFVYIGRFSSTSPLQLCAPTEVREVLSLEFALPEKEDALYFGVGEEVVTKALSPRT